MASPVQLPSWWTTTINEMAGQGPQQGLPTDQGLASNPSYTRLQDLVKLYALITAVGSGQPLNFDLINSINPQAITDVLQQSGLLTKFQQQNVNGVQLVLQGNPEVMFAIAATVQNDITTHQQQLGLTTGSAQDPNSYFNLTTAAPQPPAPGTTTPPAGGFGSFGSLAGGGGGGFGFGGGGGGGQAVAAPTTLNLPDFQAKFPQFGFMFQIPDAVADMTKWATTLDWVSDPNGAANEMQAQMDNAAWYQRIGPDFFKLILDQNTNPQLAAQTLQASEDSLRQTFTQMGLQPTDQQIQSLAYSAMANNWSSDSELLKEQISSVIQPNADGTFSVKNFTAAPDGTIVNTFVGPDGQKGANPADFQTVAPNAWISDGLLASIGTAANHPPINGPMWGMLNGKLTQDLANAPADTPLYTLPDFVPGTAAGGAAGAPSTLSGSLQTSEDIGKQMASEYLVPISGGSIAQQVAGLVQSGAADPSTYFKTYFEAQAKSLYPAMSAAIDAGITPKAYTQPYQEVAAQLLGVPADTINMMDPQYIRAVTQKDPKTGVPTALSLYDWQQLLMSDPQYGYMKTINAKDRASSLAQGLAEMFGRTAGVPGSTAFGAAGAPRIAGVPIT